MSEIGVNEFGLTWNYWFGVGLNGKWKMESGKFFSCKARFARQLSTVNDNSVYIFLPLLGKARMGIIPLGLYF